MYTMGWVNAAARLIEMLSQIFTENHDLYTTFLMYDELGDYRGRRGRLSEEGMGILLSVPFCEQRVKDLVALMGILAPWL